MIDYQKIADSVKFFENLRYTRIEAPWWVSAEICGITKPANTQDYYIPLNKKCLVASGEQSLLYTANKGRLPKGKWLTVTPCFRDESIGILSKKTFIKTELMITDRVNEEALDLVITDAMNFFKTQVPDEKLLTKVFTKDGLDICYGGIEIGSYGMRSCDFLDWIYATGCAEPRLSRAINITNKRSK